MADPAAAYEQSRVLISTWLREGGDAAAATRVPACPDWTVKDLVAHLQHVTVEYSQGRHTYATLDRDRFAAERDPLRGSVDEWANAGVAARRELTVEQLLAEWESSAQALYRMMNGQRVRDDPAEDEFLAWAAHNDCAIHYQDIRGALGKGPDRESYATKLAAATFAPTFVSHVRVVGGVPALRVVTQRGDIVFGEGEATPVEVDWFEMFRAMYGRRSTDQIVELLAPLDAGPYLPAFTLYPRPTAPLAV